VGAERRDRSLEVGAVEPALDAEPLPAGGEQEARDQARDELLGAAIGVRLERPRHLAEAGEGRAREREREPARVGACIREGAEPLPGDPSRHPLHHGGGERQRLRDAVLDPDRVAEGAGARGGREGGDAGAPGQELEVELVVPARGQAHRRASPPRERPRGAELELDVARLRQGGVEHHGGAEAVADPRDPREPRSQQQLL